MSSLASIKQLDSVSGDKSWRYVAKSPYQQRLSPWRASALFASLLTYKLLSVGRATQLSLGDNKAGNILIEFAAMVASLRPAWLDHITERVGDLLTSSGYRRVSGLVEQKGQTCWVMLPQHHRLPVNWSVGAPSVDLSIRLHCSMALNSSWCIVQCSCL